MSTVLRCGTHAHTPDGVDQHDSLCVLWKDRASGRFLEAGAREEDPWRLRDIGPVQEHLCYASWTWRQVGFREWVGRAPFIPGS